MKKAKIQSSVVSLIVTLVTSAARRALMWSCVDVTSGTQIKCEKREGRSSVVSLITFVVVVIIIIIIIIIIIVTFVTSAARRALMWSCVDVTSGTQTKCRRWPPGVSMSTPLTPLPRHHHRRRLLGWSSEVWFESADPSLLGSAYVGYNRVYSRAVSLGAAPLFGGGQDNALKCGGCIRLEDGSVEHDASP
jgi:hypothetical protein